jgi:hypothetical protein
MSNESQSPEGTMELGGHIFEVAGTATDSHGNTVQIPGKWLRKCPKQFKRSGQTAVAPTPSMAHAPVTPAPPLTRVSPASPARRLKPRRYKAVRGAFHRFQPKRPRLVVPNEPWGAAEWGTLLVVIALIVGAVWLSNAGSEDAKWKQLEGAARAVQGR